MKMKTLMRGLLAALSLFAISGDVTHAQSSNPFNPDFAWCATPGAIATRNATPPLWGCLPPGTAGQVLRTNGPGANASWQTVTGTGTVTSVGVTLPSIFSVSGSPITTTGTIAATLASQTANTFFAAPNGSAGAPTFRAIAAADMPNAGVISGGVITGTFPSLTIGASQITTAMIADGSVSTLKIAAGGVTNGRLSSMADATIKSNISGSASTPSDNTITAVLDKQLGSTQGTIAYRDVSGWQGLAPSTGGILQSNGSGANPSWVSPSAAIPAAVGIGHRITLASNTPVMTSNVTAATTIYSTPYQSDLMLLWNGTSYVPTHCAQTSQTLADTTKSPAAAVANSVYDLFAWNDAGTCRVTRGPAWTNSSTRSAGTAIARTNFGILSNSVAITNGPAANYGTYMGTIATDAGGATVTWQYGSSVTTCGAGVHNVWNMYNRVSAVSTVESVAQAGYSGAARVYLNFPACSLSLLTGVAEDNVSVSTAAGMTVSSGTGAGYLGFGINSVTAQNVAFSTMPTQATTVGKTGGFVPSNGVNLINAVQFTDAGVNVTYSGFGMSANFRY